jgi:hypothetical protein
VHQCDALSKRGVEDGLSLLNLHFDANRLQANGMNRIRCHDFTAATFSCSANLCRVAEKAEAKAELGLRK